MGKNIKVMLVMKHAALYSRVGFIVLCDALAPERGFDPGGGNEIAFVRGVTGVPPVAFRAIGNLFNEKAANLP